MIEAENDCHMTKIFKTADLSHLNDNASTRKWINDENKQILTVDSNVGIEQNGMNPSTFDEFENIPKIDCSPVSNPRLCEHINKNEPHQFHPTSEEWVEDPYNQETDSARIKDLKQTDQEQNHVKSRKPSEESLEEREVYHYDDDDIKRDAADSRVAFVVHIALFFFFLIFVVAVAISLIMAAQYGFIVLVAILSLLCLVIPLVYIINKAISDDTKFKPIQRQFRRWQAIATAVVVQEIKNFQLDVNEHLLLTDGDTDDYQSHSARDGKNKTRKKKGARSFLFGLVKPLFGKKRRGTSFKFGKRKKQEGDDGDYVPPAENILS